MRGYPIQNGSIAISWEEQVGLLGKCMDPPLDRDLEILDGGMNFGWDGPSLLLDSNSPTGQSYLITFFFFNRWVSLNFPFTITSVQ